MTTTFVPTATFGRLALDTPIGRLPAPGALNVEGTDVTTEDLEQLFAVDRDEWLAELPPIREHLATFGDRLPGELLGQLEALEARLRP